MSRVALCFFSVLALAVSAVAATPKTGDSLLVSEALRELSLMKLSTYQHATDVDEAAGRFNYDCSGFLDYALGLIDQPALQELPISHPKDARSLAEDFYEFFAQVGEKSHRWMSVAKPMDLRPGDIIAWLTPSDSSSRNTGHTLMVIEAPHTTAIEKNLVIVRVVDSTKSPHAQDTRENGATGLGSGTIGLIVDNEGHATGYKWKALDSTKSEYTSISFGRLLVAP